MSRARSVAELGNQALNLSVTEGSLKVGTGITFENTGETQFSGIITATQFVGDGSGLTGVTAAGSGVVVQEEGTNVGTAATINFVGTAVTATISGGVATVEISASGGAGGSGISNVVEDTTPQLGGDLDLNSKDITGTGRVNITGIITATTFSGSGASLTSIPAGQLTGTVADARLNTVSSSKLSGAFPAISGSSLKNLTGASEATYGSSTEVPVITVDSNGRISGISTTGVSGGGAGGGIDNVVQDTTPQLGGNLDLNSKDITGTGRVNITGIITATSFSGSLATTDLTGTITNAQLGGSIANNKLANSSIAIGGVTFNLGDNDETPALDLQDATGYPTSSLTGTITNSQLAGSIANSKLANSTVSFGGVSLALGATDATPAFDLQDATNVPAGQLTGTVADARLDTVSSSKLSGALPAISGSSLTGVVTSIVAGSNITLTGGPTGIVTIAASGGGSYGNSDVDSHLNQSNPTSGYVLSWNGSDYAWVANSGNLSNVVEDTTPQLGGNLDLNSKDITGTGNVNVTGIITATSFGGDLSDAVTSRWDVGSNGSSDYTFTGPGGLSSSNDPTIYLARGQTYEFNVNASGHPFQIRVSNGGSAYNTGVTNNGAAVGVIKFAVPFAAPNTLVYQCTSHSGMVGNIVVYPSI